MSVFGGAQYEAGTMIRFTYMAPTATDRYREIFVLNPNYNGLLHGLEMKIMTPAQKSVVTAIFDPVYQTGQKRHPYLLVNDILKRMDPSKEVTNPINFYAKFVKPFLRTAGDVYRTFYPQYMSGIQVVQKSTMKGRQITSNNKPLFHK